MRKGVDMLKRCSMFFVMLLCAGQYLLAADEPFTITVPDGWVKNSGSAALGHYQNGTGTFIITVDKMPAEASTPDAYVEFVKAKLEKALGKCTFEPVVSGKKDKRETRELNYSVLMSGMKLKYDVYYIFDADKAYTLTSCNLDKSVNEKFQSEIKTFFTTFKLK